MSAQVCPVWFNKKRGLLITIQCVSSFCCTMQEESKSSKKVKKRLDYLVSCVRQRTFIPILIGPENFKSG